MFTAIQPVFTVLGGALTLPFNIPFWFVTGQLNAAANQTTINNFVTAIGQLPGVPAAVLSYLAGIPSQTLPTIPSIPGLTTAAASPAVKTAALGAELVHGDSAGVHGVGWGVDVAVQHSVLVCDRAAERGGEPEGDH
nr:hypothetical protein [Mycobacteroides salmoniphilum]